MTKVFRERFPEAEVVNAEFVDFADAVTAARKQIPAAAAAATATAAAESPPDDAGDGTAKTQAKKDNTAAASGAAIGVITFNSVFGNLWSQGMALERAADILEVRGRELMHPGTLGRSLTTGAVLSSVHQEYSVLLAAYACRRNSCRFEHEKCLRSGGPELEAYVAHMRTHDDAYFRDWIFSINTRGMVYGRLRETLVHFLSVPDQFLSSGAPVHSTA